MSYYGKKLGTFDPEVPGRIVKIDNQVDKNLSELLYAACDEKNLKKCLPNLNDQQIKEVANMQVGLVAAVAYMLDREEGIKEGGRSDNFPELKYAFEIADKLRENLGSFKNDTEVDTLSEKNDIEDKLRKAGLLSPKK